MVTVTGLVLALALAPNPPKVGDRAIPFSVASVSGPAIDLVKTAKMGPVVLVILRGFPGYQCPLCTMQVGDLLASADKFAEAKAQVIMIYPGPATDLKMRAGQFLRDRKLPANFRLGIDPDFKVVNQYGLRWDAPAETAYPSSFVIGRNGKVKYAKVSKEHGDRASAKSLLEALAKPDAN